MYDSQLTGLFNSMLDSWQTTINCMDVQFYSELSLVSLEITVSLDKSAGRNRIKGKSL